MQSRTIYKPTPKNEIQVHLYNWFAHKGNLNYKCSDKESQHICQKLPHKHNSCLHKDWRTKSSLSHDDSCNNQGFFFIYMNRKLETTSEWRNLGISWSSDLQKVTGKGSYGKGLREKKPSTLYFNPTYRKVYTEVPNCCAGLYPKTRAPGRGGENASASFNERLNRKRRDKRGYVYRVTGQD